MIISPQARRRFILGKQGLWPGRRWRGKKGVEKALKAIQMVQIDSNVVVAQSQDLVLWGRVLDYQPSFLTDLIYKDRKFFDYGGGLTISPMEEMPYVRVVMKRKAQEERWAQFAKQNASLIQTVKRELRKRGPTRSRDLEGEAATKYSYRSSKNVGVALYYLWLVGELMISRREGKERVYDFIENIVPAQFSRTATPREMEDYFAIKAVSLAGIINRRSFRNSWKGFIERWVDHQEGQKKVLQMLESGTITEVKLEKEKDPYFVLTIDLPKLRLLLAGKIPKDWRPVETTNEEEVIFLSPLELVSARGRAKILFDFDYLWEIYKPQSKRKYGPYTMPILYADQLVGRADFKMVRLDKTLVVNGVWPEPWFKPDKQFKRAWSKGLVRFAKFLGAETVRNPG